MIVSRILYNDVIHTPPKFTRQFELSGKVSDVPQRGSIIQFRGDRGVFLPMLVEGVQLDEQENNTFHALVGVRPLPTAT